MFSFAVDWKVDVLKLTRWVLKAVLIVLFCFVFFFLLTEIFVTTTSLTTISLQNLRLQKITINNYVLSRPPGVCFFQRGKKIAKSFLLQPEL